MFEGLHARVAKLNDEVTAIAYAARDPRTPWLARLLVVAIVAYAVSPIDLIPDFIPVLGFLDDLVLLPLGLLVARRLIPDAALEDARRRASERPPPSRTAALVIVLIWLAAAAVTIFVLWPQVASTKAVAGHTN